MHIRSIDISVGADNKPFVAIASIENGDGKVHRAHVELDEATVLGLVEDAEAQAVPEAKASRIASIEAELAALKG